MKNFEIEKLEKEFEEKIASHNKPTKSDWIPYEKFIKQNKTNVK